MKIFKNILIYPSLVILLASCSNTSTQIEQSAVNINNQKIVVDIANTPALRHQGLSGRPKLEENHGMLFIFDSYTRTSFIMRDMLFPLDILWIKDDQIIGCAKNLPAPKAEESPALVSPPADINYTLEVNAGFCDKNNIKHGDPVQYMLK